MTNETKHTPTPWVSNNHRIMSGETIIGTTHSMWTHVRSTRASEDANVDAAHIVKCVNMHDELVEALRNMVDKSGCNNSELMAKALDALAKSNGEAL